MMFGTAKWRGMVAGTACAVVAGTLFFTAVDLFTFLFPSSPRTGMSGTWNPMKLWWMSALCLVASLLCGLNAWKIFQPASRQRAAADNWSPLAVLLWWVPALLVLLVHYPLPYFSHHIDKCFLVVGLILLWSAWLLVHPSSLSRGLESRSFCWLRVALINGLVFLLLAEGAMRLADPFLARSGLFSSRNDTPGGGIPFQVTDRSGMRTNSRGFRDRERTVTPVSSALRIVALGDSFAWGSGVTYDEAFLTLVERGLDDVWSGTEVINLGMVGYQPEEYLSLLKEHGLAYQPNVVLVNFFIGNDFMPAQGAQVIVAGHRHRVHVNGNWFHDHFSWDHWYLPHDLAYAWLLGQARIRRVMGQSDLGMFASGPEQAGGGDSASFSGWSPQYVRMIQGMGDQFLKRETQAFSVRWSETRHVLEQLAALLQERGLPWVLVMLPAEEQIDPELQRLYVNMRGGVPDDYDFSKPQRLLSDWARGKGVMVIDLAPSFRANVSRRRLYVDNDIHWNKNGNALAAETMLDELRPALARVGRIASH
ncbi:MAG: hypothetical protein GDA67_10955 [Nitrospira sp. CR1.3]|nr:hypothetical protein [Nitrospira sp. CR1.3]